MGNNRSNQNKSTSTNFFDVLTKYGIVILIALFIIPYIIKYYKDQIEKGKVEDVVNDVAVNNAQNATQNPTMQVDKATKYLRDVKHYDTKGRQRLMDATQKIVNAFGYDKAWYNPKSWTENDLEIYLTLWECMYNYKDLEWLYYNVYTQSRNLTNDIVDKLDTKYLTELRRKFKKANIKAL
jgi:hypothetical protein